jgi:hypothetical protein
MVVVLSATLATACATPRTAHEPAEARCYSHVYLDEQYGIQVHDAPLRADEGSRGCYEVRYDALGRVARLDYRRAGAPAPDPLFGVPTVVIERIGGGETRRYLSAGGTPMANGMGVYAVRLRYDRRGHPIEWASLGGDGRPIEDPGSGLALVRWSYDQQGNTVEERYLGRDGRLRDSKHRGVAVVQWRYDLRGNTLEERYLGPDERLKPDLLRGVAIVRWSYDADGRVVEERYLGPDERPVEDRHRGVAVVRWRHDKRGQLIEERYFGIDGEPKRDRRRGAAVIRWHQPDSLTLGPVIPDPQGSVILDSKP